MQTERCHRVLEATIAYARLICTFYYNDKYWWINSVFTALHGMQTRSYDEISVRPSVRLSVCQTRAL